MMSDSNAGATAQVGALTNGHTHAQGDGSVSGTGADGGAASSADGVDGGGEAEPPLAADTPGVESLGAGCPPGSLAWGRAQNFPPDVPVLGKKGRTLAANPSAAALFAAKARCRASPSFGLPRRLPRAFAACRASLVRWAII